MTGAVQRYRNKNVYFLEDVTKTKTQAKKSAKALREKGKLAFIEKKAHTDPRGNKYRVFGGTKHRSHG